MKQGRWGSVGRLALLAFMLASGAQASFLFTDAGSHALRYGDGFSLGSKFTVLDTGIQVTALGIYDPTGTGFLQTHDVALWDVTAGNSEVAQVTVPTGTGAVLSNGFRYVDLGTPVTLIDGDQYILAAFYPVGEVNGVNDHLRDCCGGGSNPATDANFGSFSAQYSTTGLGTSAGHLTEPTNSIAGTDYAGPNFRFQSVPEPSTWLLSGLGVAGLLGRRRRKSNV